MKTQIKLMTAAAILFTASQARAADPAWNEFQYGNNTLDFHGYVRSTVGAAGNGDIMPMFMAPGAGAKYRLGNESDSYAELALDYHYYLDAPRDPHSRYVQLYGMLSEYQPNPDYTKMHLEFDHNHDAQSFVRFGNFLGDDVNAWFGRRYYDRHDIHMMDYFWMNTGQGADFGGGIEGIPLGVGRLDVASFLIRDTGVADLLGGGATDVLNTHTLDLRYHDIPLSKDNSLTLWALGSHREANDTIHFGGADGFGLGGWNTAQNVMSGRDITALLYRHGVAVQQSQYSAVPIREDEGYGIGAAWSAELNNDWYAELPQKDLGVQWATVLRHTEQGANGAGGGSSIDWASTGVRPVFYLTDHISFVPEVGIDHVNDRVIDAAGWLGKGTLALQFAPKKGYFERPVLRLFATGAVWSKDLKGFVANGNPPAAGSYANDTMGSSYGVQFEWWW